MRQKNHTFKKKPNNFATIAKNFVVLSRGTDNGRCPKTAMSSMTKESALHNPGNTQHLPHLEAMYRQHAPQGIRYAYSMLRNASDAEEANQDAFCRMLTKSAEWTSDEVELKLQQFAAVFFTTLRNLCIDQLRKKRQLQNVALDDVPELVAKTESTTIQQLEAFLLKSIDQMPSYWADALKLKINGQLSYAEIAEVLESTHSQVRTWIFRARRYLDSELKMSGYNTVDK